MAAKRRQRRRSGSLGSLKSALWAVITYNLDVIEDDTDDTIDHELRQKACNSLTQAAMAYSRIVEQHDMQRKLDALKALAQGNGYLS